MKIGVVTLFSEMFEILRFGIMNRAIMRKLVEIICYDPRDFTKDKHRTVDDRPYGGGPGMLMLAEPLCQAIAKAKQSLGAKTKVIYLSPTGKLLEHADIVSLSEQDSLILLAGRYEGIDERVIDKEVDMIFSIGDYVLSGGELPAMVLIDAITRLIPGALSDENSAKQDSFVNGLLDHPHYTRPEVFDNLAVPKVLLSGDHQLIAKWRLKQSLGRTWLKRPDLLARLALSSQQQKLLDEFILEMNGESDEQNNC